VPSTGKLFTRTWLSLPEDIFKPGYAAWFSKSKIDWFGVIIWNKKPPSSTKLLYCMIHIMYYVLALTIYADARH